MKKYKKTKKGLKVDNPSLKDMIVKYLKKKTRKKGGK